MIRLFKKEIKTQSINSDYIQEKRKEDLEDFILILKQIQEANNAKESGKGSFFKNYKRKQLLIDNLIRLAIEKTEEKIKELG